MIIVLAVILGVLIFGQVYYPIPLKERAYLCSSTSGGRNETEDRVRPESNLTERV